KTASHFALTRRSGSGSYSSFCFDAFSSREPVSIPDQVRDRLSLENALGSAKTLRRARDRLAAAGGDPHHREPALVGAVGAETEQPVDAGKAGGAGERIRRELLARVPGQRRDQRDRIIGERCRSHRLAAELGPIAGREGPEAGRVRRRIESAL